tara:strand:+ start:118 stop:816 length:699 start_codon:yes stop_codon:yes gene_type:complete
MFEFLRDELTEARYMRTPRDTVGRSEDNIAQGFFEHLMVLQQMRFENPAFAKKYAKDTLRYAGFSNVRTGATDLHNMASILNNPGKFADKLGGMGDTRFDELAFKRFLRNVATDKYVPGQDRAFFLKTQKNLGIKNSLLKKARRIMGDYGGTTPQERASVSLRLTNSFRQDGKFRSDLFSPYATTIKRNKTVPQEEKKGMGLGTKTAIATIAGFGVGYAIGKGISAADKPKK